MNNELIQALDYLEYERGVDRETLIKLINDALRAAARKAIEAYEDVDVNFDLDTGKIQCIANLLVVQDEASVTQPGIEIPLVRAVKIKEDAQPGDKITLEVTPENFGRIAASTARQFISQQLKQAEKKIVCESFRNQLFQLVTGVVKRVETHELIIDFNQVEGVMRFAECIPGEDFDIGDNVTALLIEINSEPTKPTLCVSRRHPDFVTRLFEREVAEISNNVVEIKGIAREAGFRSKIAVYTTQPKVDPVGACVGLRGSRVKTIVHELCGEKVDIIQWDPDIKVFVANALKPAKLASIEVDEAKKLLTIKVTEDQLSLSIGKKGQNARLASRLTGWKIDIDKITSQSDASQDDYDEKVGRAISALAAIDGIGQEAAEILVKNGFLSAEGVVYGGVDDIAALEGIDHDKAVAIVEGAKAFLG